MTMPTANQRCGPGKTDTAVLGTGISGPTKGKAMREVVPPETLAASKQSEASDIPDLQAVRLAQQGDPAAFEHLYRKHNRRVYALCLRMIGNSTDAEDLTQEAFLQVF